MPPRLNSLSLKTALPSQIVLPPTFLLPCLYQQSRTASILSSLSDVPSAYNRRIRRGRGPSSGKGKTAGRGQKGQKARGKAPYGFQGGQTVEHVVKGIRGEQKVFSADLSPVNLDTIQEWINQGRLDPTKPITLKELKSSRAIHGVGDDGFKLLGRGAKLLTSPINIIASRASASAIEAVEATGGKVTTRYYTKSAIKRIMQRQTHPYASQAWKGEDHLRGSELEKGFKYRLPDPVRRKALEYYRDPMHRGYLSYQISEGESPSLFFQTPEQAAKRAATKKEEKKPELAANRVW